MSTNDGSPETTRDFELHTERRKAHRIDRTKLFLLAQAGTLILVLLILWSFWQDPARPISKRQELLTQQHNIKPEGLDKLPTSYDHMKSANLKSADAKVSMSRRSTVSVQTNIDLKARQAPLFFNLKQRLQNRTVRANPKTPLSSQLNSLTENLDQRLQALSPGKDTAQDDQRKKLSFLKTAPTGKTRNSHSLQKPRSPFTLMAGTIIAASLLTGLNSDLPGQVIAHITEPVYDTVTGRYLLIPQGSKLIGTYDSRIAYAQTRALVAWQRIILPNGTSVVIDNLPATDPAGYSGLNDTVDNHIGQLLRGVALATVLNVGTELTFGGNENELVAALRQASQNSVQRAGDRIIQKKLDVQPTLKIRPGWPLRILVAKDIIMKPYQEN